ncbi:tubby-related protein 4 [Sitodiplosis mosellana]|uniref:tubby-related protein 4 n=1 Tax=Sitodiplosis mosellana TaxID=263140 RepID=UPI002445003A|nr:tubby-related protein 4 [Sitodiplosis mosellana]
MHLHFEKSTNAKCDCSIVSLSWMGKVPEHLPEEDGWKLTRTNYYQEGWLATGNIRGIVGVTFTTSTSKKNMDYPLRTNYNLRGHRSDVTLVKWNEPYQKLASCDSTGIIFVWIKYEGRWSIELINDRNTPVTHFSWSHDGRMALICYQDGFVLVGSVAGQRYWSSMLNLDSIITCGIWTPDDQQVYFGTAHGQIIVMDVHGAMVSQVQLYADMKITSMAWSCEKFKMEEGEDDPGVTNAGKRNFILAVSFQNGFIYLLKSYDDVSPVHINTDMNGSIGFVMEWSNAQELLAVAGTLSQSVQPMDSQGALVFHNVVKFYTETGYHLYTARIPSTSSPVSALTWGHSDKRLFIATGTQVHIAWVSRKVATLQLLCRLQVQNCIGSELMVPKLPLPSRIKSLITNMYSQTIRCCVPNMKSLREFVSRPPSCSIRLHCTMIRHDDENNVGSGVCYTLYLEYLGGLVPLLKGKKTSKIRPEFVIFDPQVSPNNVFHHYTENGFEAKSSSDSSGSTVNHSDSSDSENEGRYRNSPRPRRRNSPQQPKLPNQNNDRASNGNANDTNDPNDDLAYVDTLPEEVKLVEVTSNLWGTKFKIHGLAKTVPANLGQVTYKTSFLHLQPRQMTLVITELRDDFPLHLKTEEMESDQNFNPNVFSEDEDEQSALNQKRSNANESAPMIAPMSPRPNRFPSRSKNGNLSKTEKKSLLGPLAKAEMYEDDVASSEQNVENQSQSQSKPIRPKHIETSITSSCRPGPSYSSFVAQYSRSSSNGSGQSRHAISPLCCEGSVPTLQSPKNAVGPSDTIFERPPAVQTAAIINYPINNNDYTNSIVHTKSSISNEQSKSNAQHIPPNQHLSNGGNAAMTNGKNSRTTDRLHSKKKDLQYIDDDTPTASGVALATATTAPATSSNETNMHRTTTVVSISPACLNMSMTRSCSVGYLDSVDTPSDEALSMLRKETPNKRLVLVDRKPNKKTKQTENQTKKMKLIKCGKSKSLDSCDLKEIPVKGNTNDGGGANVMPKLCEGHESETDSPSHVRRVQPKLIETSIIGALSSATEQLCLNCQNATKLMQCEQCRKTSTNVIVDQIKTVSNSSSSKSSISSFTENTPKPPSKLDHMLSEAIKASSSSSSNSNSSSGRNKMERNKAKPPKKNTEVITSYTGSYTDSPLFSRKHRFGEEATSSRYSNSDVRSSPLLCRKFETGISLLKQFSEARKRKKEENLQLIKADSQSDLHQTSSNDTKAPVALHTQALTTLENIISRLRDLDDNHSRLNPPSSPQHSRYPRSSPASPALSKKSKRNSSTSPIRHLLNSPLLNRKNRKKQQVESSDDESHNNSNEDSPGKYNSYRDLETFQKAQLRQKLKRGKIEPNGQMPTVTQPAPLRREFVMHNKAPMWNEHSQVYQLDFGGRVTQESAKNFQIEFRGKQVMQFGRIDGNAYTLDFQYPFSALQAFSVALANVTQRLK